MADNLTPPWFTQGMSQMAQLPQLLKQRAPEQEEQGNRFPNRTTAFPKKPVLHWRGFQPLRTLHPLNVLKTKAPRSRGNHARNK